MYIFEKPRVLDLSELCQMLKKFDSLDIEKKKSFISRVVKHHGVLNYNVGGNIQLCRVRNFPKGIPQYLQDILWPTTSGAHGNRFGNNVTYLASSLNVALAETDDKHRKRAIYTVFKMRERKFLRVVAVGDLENLINGSNGVLCSIGAMAEYGQVINEAFVANEDLTYSYIVQSKFLAEQLLSGDSELSTYTAEKIFSAIDYDAILYPSKKNPSGYNIACKKDSMADRFSVHYSCIVDIYEIYNKIYKTYTKYTLTDICNKNELIWSEIPHGFDNLYSKIKIH